MDRRLLIPFAIGVAVIVAAVVWVFYIQQGAHIELRGSILKIRTHAADENSSIAVIDFRALNPSDYKFIVRQVDVLLEDKDGRTLEGQSVAEWMPNGFSFSSRCSAKNSTRL